MVDDWKENEWFKFLSPTAERKLDCQIGVWLAHACSRNYFFGLGAKDDDPPKNITN